MIMIDSLNVISMHAPNRELQGLSGVGIEYPCFGWPSGGSKILVLDGLWAVLKLEWNPLHPRTPPLEATGFLAFLATSIGPLFFSFFFFPHFRPIRPELLLFELCI